MYFSLGYEAKVILKQQVSHDEAPSFVPFTCVCIDLSVITEGLCIELFTVFKLAVLKQ